MAARKTASALAIAALAVSSAAGQCMRTIGPPAAIDANGVHSNSGRGCVGCHSPHKDANVSTAGLWARTAGPSQRLKLTLDGDASPAEPTNFSTQPVEVDGVVLCLSCHDGNLTPQSMLSGQSYEERVGFLQDSRRPAPTLRDPDNSWQAAGVDHPFGPVATIELGNGLGFSQGKFSVAPGTPYAQFVSNYGWPTLAPVRWNSYGIDPQGRPYLVCTTCHNQHEMSEYIPQSISPIAGGQMSYPTLFSLNGPYSPAWSGNGQNASSAAQFCRQCHFNVSNEGNNTRNILTSF